MTVTRQEKDTFGLIDVPADKLWGAQTQRSLQNFDIAGDRMPRELIDALARIKRASAAVNQRLSLRRAEVVAREMESRGFPAAGLQVRGLGAARPIADNATEAGRTQNRRVAVIVRSD